MKKLILLSLMLLGLTANAAIMQQFGTTNNAVTLTNIIMSMAGGGSGIATNSGSGTNNVFTAPTIQSNLTALGPSNYFSGNITVGGSPNTILSNLTIGSSTVLSTNALTVWGTNLNYPVFEVGQTNGRNEMWIAKGGYLLQGFINEQEGVSVNSAGTLTVGGAFGGSCQLNLGNREFLMDDQITAVNLAIYSAQNQSTMAGIRAGVVNKAYTANQTLTSAAVGSSTVGLWINNLGAGAAVTNTLPVAVLGMQYHFYVGAAQILCVQAQVGDTIRYIGTVSASGGNIFSSTVGSCIHLFSPVANVWIVDKNVGTWTGPQ